MITLMITRPLLVTMVAVLLITDWNVTEAGRIHDRTRLPVELPMKSQRPRLKSDHLESPDSSNDMERNSEKFHQRETRSSDKASNHSGEDPQTNCSIPNNLSHPWYNSSCQFVQAECKGESQLINYLSFVVCSLEHVQPLGYVLMAVWMAYLIALLATTVDNHFVPPLTYISEKMKLSPSIAGITLMALGNGVSQGDMALVLGSLTGGGIFITTVVLGTVIIVTKVKPFKLDKVDFIRDVMAYIVVAAVVVIVAFDETVYLVEACMFPVIYAGYILFVIGISYLRKHLNKKHKKPSPDDELLFWDEEADKTTSLERSLPLRLLAKALLEEKVLKELPESHSERANLSGLTWPTGSHFVFKILWFIQWPFSVVRWMTIPPFVHDGHWTKWHWLLTVCSPTPMAMLLLIATKGWSGFTIHVGRMPLPAILVIIGVALTVLLLFLMSPKHRPHWAMQLVLVPAAFSMSIVWLNIEANEIVSVLKAFGLLLNIDTAVLGLTVLAVGNSVADWVADTVVARCGRPEMAYASCFGSPLMSNVMGLSVALIVKIALNHGSPYQFQIQTPEYSLVKLAWIFLAASLLSTLVFVPLFRFSPPRTYGAVLIIVVYGLFVVFVVLGESGVVPLNL